MRPVLATLTALVLGSTAAADPLETLRGVSAEGPVYAFDVEFEADGVTAIGSVDPTRPAGNRIVLTAPPRTEWSEDFAEGIAQRDREADGDIWCQNLVEQIPDTASLASDNGNSVTYTFTPVPEDGADGPEKKMFRSLVGSAVVSKTGPILESFQLHLPEPMKPHFLVKIERFSMFAECERSPDGRAYLANLNIDIAGSAMGRRFSETTAQQITRLFEPSNS
ncbi:MAG: hypothetical protein AAFR00_04200 [Pseudomonadota bacterium]